MAKKPAGIRTIPPLLSIVAAVTGLTAFGALAR
jgi:hypothetical protein